MSIKWQYVPHTRKSFTTTLLLLVAAVVVQLETYYLLRACGLSAGSRSLGLLIIFPGGIFWYVAFAYAFYFRVQRSRPRHDPQNL